MPNTRTSGSLAVVLLALASTAASQVSGTIEDQLDGEIVDAAVAQAGAGVEEGVLDTLDDQVAEDVEAAVDESLDDAVDQQADDAVTAGVEETLEDTVETTVEDSLDETVEQQADDAVTAGVEETLDETVEQQTGDALASSVEETLEGTVESTLEGNLDSVVEGAVESGIAGGDTLDDTIRDGASWRANGERASRSVGMIDSALDPAHPAIADRAIEQRDFVTVDAARPVGHGTAVASILCAGLPDDTGVLAASVFFSYEGMAPGASTESLVAALDWMLERGMDTVNMSLSGPPNALLQEAIEDASGRGVTIVAAVGNNGPAGRPLFPAAYPEVVGVTAVDRDNRVFLYANRGKHVVFASPGVDVRVADVGGGYRTASGTSMASPRVAARIAAEATRSRGSRPAVERLKGTATDLGEAGFDPVFGYGLVDAAAQ